MPTMLKSWDRYLIYIADIAFTFNLNLSIIHARKHQCVLVHDLKIGKILSIHPVTNHHGTLINLGSLRILIEFLCPSYFVFINDINDINDINVFIIDINDINSGFFMLGFRWVGVV